MPEATYISPDDIAEADRLFSERRDLERRRSDAQPDERRKIDGRLSEIAARLCELMPPNSAPL